MGRKQGKQAPRPISVQKEGRPMRKEFRPGIYRHFKGNLYRLDGLAKHSETQEDYVVYQALYGERGLWVRPAKMWNEEVNRNGYVGKRFVWVAETEEEALCRNEKKE